MEARFAVGHQVGQLARRLYPDGILIGDEKNDLRAALEQTNQVLRDFPNKPIFEATFQHAGILIRSDLLIPANGGYRVVEVKSSTSVKDYHLPDCAIQSWVIEHNRVKLSQVSLMRIDNQFVYKYACDYQGLLVEDDVTTSVQTLMPEVPEWLSECQKTLAGKVPEVEIGPQCSKPFACPYYAHCSVGQPEFPVTLLPGNMGKRGMAEQLKKAGYSDLMNVPEGVIDSPPLEKIRRITVSGKAELDSAVRDEMKKLPYPRYYLDFETIQYSVPVWLCTRPFQQIPFQWSCHIEQKDGQLDHHEFLDLTGDFPVLPFCEQMVSALGNDGPILVYNQSFEKSRIQEMADMFSEVAHQMKGLVKQEKFVSGFDKQTQAKLCLSLLEPLGDGGRIQNMDQSHLLQVAQQFSDMAIKLVAINERIVDLLPLTRQYYYHPAMKGSWSIKSVLPTIAPDLDYANLDEVKDGGLAQSAYLEAISPDTELERKVELRNALLKYCERDTIAMVRLARFLGSEPVSIEKSQAQGYSERSAKDIHPVFSSDPIPTVEVDLHSMPEDVLSYADLILGALRKVASGKPSMRASIYIEIEESVNFGEPSESVFIGVVGHDGLLEIIFSALQSVKGVKFRFSDFINPADAFCDIHIEDGQVWQPLDAMTWYVEE